MENEPSIQSIYAVEASMMQKNHAEPENEGMQPNPEYGIQQAMKWLASINEELLQITKQIEERQCVARHAYDKIFPLETREKNFRWLWSKNGNKLASLKRDLNKLTFANNQKAIKTEDQKINNIHDLQFLMHHGNSNMAKEKKLLKEINTSSQKNSCNSGLSVVQEINNCMRKLQWSYHPFLLEPAMNVDKNQLRQQIIAELKWAKDNNSLPSKKVIKKQIKLMEKAPNDEDRKEHLRVRAKIQQLKQERNAALKDVGSLKREFFYVRSKKGKAYKLLLKYIKIRDQ